MSKALALLALLLSLLAVHLFYIPSPSTEQLKSLRDTVVVICGASSGKGSSTSMLRPLRSDAQRVHLYPIALIKSNTITGSSFRIFNPGFLG